MLVSVLVWCSVLLYITSGYFSTYMFHSCSIQMLQHFTSELSCSSPFNGALYSMSEWGGQEFSCEYLCVNVCLITACLVCPHVMQGCQCHLKSAITMFATLCYIRYKKMPIINLISTAEFIHSRGDGQVCVEKLV